MKLTATAAAVALSYLSTIVAAPIPASRTLTEADKTNLRRDGYYERIQQVEYRGPVYVPPPEQVMAKSTSLWNRQRKNERRIRAFEPFQETRGTLSANPAFDLEMKELGDVGHASGNADKVLDLSKPLWHGFRV